MGREAWADRAWTALCPAEGALRGKSTVRREHAMVLLPDTVHTSAKSR